MHLELCTDPRTMSMQHFKSLVDLNFELSKYTDKSSKRAHCTSTPPLAVYENIIVNIFVDFSSIFKSVD